jgi:hypothetical protein
MTTVKVIRFLDGDPALAESLRERWAEALANTPAASPPGGR